MLRIGVVGGGLIAQAMHLHYLAAKRNRFAITALAEPSLTVRDALGARYGIAGLHADHRSLVEAGDVDALVVCSPAGTHAEIVLAALGAGLHVFVEKPMCITLRDADAIVAERDRTGRVVQVGTMKRFDSAYERMLADLPDSAEALRYVSVVVSDPEFEPFFGPGEIVRGSDVPREVIEATARAEREQVEEAVGSGAPDVVLAFSESYLGSLVHDVNLVHGLLERMGEPLPAQVVDGAWWAGGRSVTGALRLANGSRWDNAWIQLLEAFEYRESVTLYFADSVRSLVFPSPWQKHRPTIYRLDERRDGANAAREAMSYEEAFSRELDHFHACVVDGETCRTPPEQARLDIEVLTAMFDASRA
jgi:Oxidoreductase family, NAD-binding Rossmann fold